MREKTKKYGNGFKFRIAQAVIYTLSAIAVFIVAFVMLGRVESSLMKAMAEYLEQVSVYDLDLPYYDDESGEFYAVLYLSNEPYISVRYDDNVYVYYDFVSEDETAETIEFENRQTGEKLTVAYSCFGYYESFCNHNEYYKQTFKEVLIIGCIPAFWAIVQWVVAFAGKKSLGANTLGIVFNALMTFCYGFGALGLVGCVKGRMALQFAAEKSLLYAEQGANNSENDLYENTAEYSSVNAASAETSVNTSYVNDSAEAEGGVETTEQLEYIQPKLSPKAKKGMFIAVIVSYSLLLLVGILLISVPALSKIFIGICQEINARAYAVTVGTMWLALLPTIGYYIAFVAPLELGKSKKIVISIVSCLLSVALCAVFFVVIYFVKIDGISVNLYFENDDVWFIPASMVFAVVCLPICYVLTLFKINPSKIKTQKPKEYGSGVFNAIKYAFAWLIYGIVKLTKAILTFKEKRPEIFVFLAAFLFTWFVYFVSFIAAIIVIALLICVVCLWFFGVIHYFDSPSKYTPKQISVDGKILTKNDNIAGYGYSEVYTDQYGNVYYSNDGGKSVVGSLDREIAEHEAELEQIREEEDEQSRREDEEYERLRRLDELNRFNNNR